MYALYPENMLEEDEFRFYSKFYLSLYFKHVYKGHHTEDEFIHTHIEGFLENLYCSMILVNLYWGFWSILMIDEKKINDKIFNFTFFSKRLSLNQNLLQRSYIKDCINNKIMLYTEYKETIQL